jgi:hypothetical protein
MIVDLNVLVYAFKFYMTTDIILIVMMQVMCKNYWSCWERTTANDGHPQVKEKYKRIVVKRINEGNLGVPINHH